MVHLDDLLQKTSRSFALAIPLLPEPTRKAVSVAYLLFRVADTFEDATEWPPAQRRGALQSFAEVLGLDGVRRYGEARRRVLEWTSRPPVTHAGYLELLEKSPEVLAELDSLAPPVRAAVARHAARTARGMAEREGRAVSDLQDLQAYCYLVAGIVGELLTEVFLEDAPALAAVRGELERATRGFGEGLQLVNVLKDAGVDAREGRAFLPPGVERAAVLALARRGLDDGEAYVQALQRGGAPPGFLGFTGLSLMLARATLARLEAEGPGAKVPRDEVARLFTALMADVSAGRPLALRP